MKTIILMRYILFIIFILLFSCNGKPKEIKYTLVFNPDSSNVMKPFFRDSFLITYYSNDSIRIQNYFNDNYYENNFFSRNNNFFEKRVVTNYPEEFFGIDTILTFSSKDTSFFYQSKRDNFIVTLVDLSLYNSQYIIQQNEKGYKTLKQSLKDPTYKEIFFYDKKYNIYKFINIWGEYKTIYTIKKD